MIIRPIMLILASFVAGILACAYLSEAVSISPAPVLIVLIILLTLSLIATVKRHFSARFFLYPSFFLFGALFILPTLTSHFEANHITNFVDAKPSPLGASFEAVLLKEPQISNGQVRLTSEVTKFYPRGGDPIDVTGRVRLKVTGRADQEHPGELTGLLRGDSFRFLATLSRPKNFNNPGGFDYEWWLARKRVYVTGRISNKDFIVKTANGRPALLRSMQVIRGRINGFIDNYSSENNSKESGAIIKALVTGDRSSINNDTRESFINTGTAHILAISGLHIGIVALFSYLVLFNILRLSERLSLALNIKKLSWALTLFPVGFYGLLAGASVSTQRAIIMISTFVLAYLLDRSRNLYATLALAALIVLLLHPGSLWDASFQFSFSSVFAIFYLTRKLDNIFLRKKNDGIIKEQSVAFTWFSRKILILVFITTSASIATIPLSIYHFGNVPLVGMPLNLIAVPILSIILVPLSLISISLIGISETLATHLLTLDSLFVNTLVSLIKAAASPGWSHIKVSTISIIEIASFYLLIFVLVEFKKRRYLLYLLPVLIIGLSFPTIYNYYQLIANKELKVTFLNVGQGEATFIEFPGGKTMLIDGGASYRGGFDIGELVISPFLRSKRIRKIDYLVMSHAQRDHKGGLPFIARSFNIGEFWWNGKGNIPAITKALSVRRTPGLTMDSTSKITDINGVQVRILNPVPEERDGLNLNEASLVMKLTYGKNSILFTGDIGLQTETLLKETGGLKADILKAPHHGSRYSSSTGFLDSVSPDFVVISAGERNSYGFPHKEALKRYKDKKAKIFRTDKGGAIEAVIDREQIKIKSYLKLKPLI